MGWSDSYVCLMETDRSIPHSWEKIARLLAALSAEDRLAEFQELAQIAHQKVVIKFTPKVDPAVRDALLLLGRVYDKGELDGRIARSLRRLLEKRGAA